jgi:hypothetical protein
MKDQIRSLLSRQNTPIQSTLIVREYLQARILEALQRSGGLLRTSLEQTGPKLDDEAVKDWRSSVLARLREAHWQRVVLDVTPFLERAQDIELLTRENLLALLGSPRSPK